MSQIKPSNNGSVKNDSPVSPEITIIKAAQELEGKPCDIRYLLALDEVGRGALVGDLVVGVTAFLYLCDAGDDIKQATLAQNSLLSRAKDSKKLSKTRRADLFSDTLSVLESISESDVRSTGAGRENPGLLINQNPDLCTTEHLLPPDPTRLMYYGIQSSFAEPFSVGYKSQSPNRRAYRRVDVMEKGGQLQSDSSLDATKADALLLFDFSLAAASPREIETLGVQGATHLAMTRGVSQSLEKIAVLDVLSIDDVATKTIVIIDGDQEMAFPQRIMPAVQAIVVKGDERLKSLSLASIVAKVARDNVIDNLALSYPAYGFDRHKGYGTPAHYEALKKYGPTPFHRRNFRLGSKKS